MTMKTDERNKFAIKSFLGEYLDLKKDKDNELETVDSIRKGVEFKGDRKSTRLNSSHTTVSRMPSSA